MLVDRSGSMAAIARPMEKAINDFITAQKKIDQPCKFTLVQFDSPARWGVLGEVERAADWYMTIYDNADLKAIEPNVRISPRGNTPLYDAQAKCLLDMEAKIALHPKRQWPKQKLVIIVTDGLNNASILYSKKQIADMIKLYREEKGYDIIFLGANMDAVAEGTEMCVLVGNNKTWQATDTGTQCMANELIAATNNYRESGKSEVTDYFGLVMKEENK